MRATFVAIAALLASFALGQSSAPPVRHPNILLITLDTTRADRRGFPRPRQR